MGYMQPYKPEEAACMLKEKAAKQEAELKEEDAKAHAQGGIYRA